LKFFGEGVCKNQLQMLFGACLNFRPGAVFLNKTESGFPDQIVVGINNLGTHIWNDPSVVNTKTQHIINMHLCLAFPQISRQLKKRSLALVDLSVKFGICCVAI
jgi:hypothetical protein